MLSVLLTVLQIPVTLTREPARKAKDSAEVRHLFSSCEQATAYGITICVRCLIKFPSFLLLLNWLLRYAVA